MVRGRKKAAEKNGSRKHKKRTAMKTKVSSMLSGPYNGVYGGRYGDEMENRSFSVEEKKKLFSWLSVLNKNVKMLPNKGWEKFLENSGIIDEAFVAVGKQGNDYTNKLWRAKHWRLLLNTIYDWYKSNHKNMMCNWGRQVKSKCVLVG